MTEKQYNGLRKAKRRSKLFSKMFCIECGNCLAIGDTYYRTNGSYVWCECCVEKEKLNRNLSNPLQEVKV